MHFSLCTIIYYLRSPRVMIAILHCVRWHRTMSAALRIRMCDGTMRCSSTTSCTIRPTRRLRCTSAQATLTGPHSGSAPSKQACNLQKACLWKSTRCSRRHSTCYIRARQQPPWACCSAEAIVLRPPIHHHRRHHHRPPPFF